MDVGALNYPKSGDIEMTTEWVKVAPGLFMMSMGCDEDKVCGWVARFMDKWVYRITKNGDELASGPEGCKSSAARKAERLVISFIKRTEKMRMISRNDQPDLTLSA